MLVVASAIPEHRQSMSANSSRCMMSSIVSQVDAADRRSRFSRMALRRTPLTLRGGSGRRNQPFDVARHALGDRQHRRAVAGGAQAHEVGLRVALILSDERRRKRNVGNRTIAHELGDRKRILAVGLAYRVDRRCGDVVVRRCRAAAEVEDPASLRAIEKIEVYFHDLLDRNKIAPLLARGVALRALEEPDAAIGAVLIEEMEHDRGHALLVLLAREIDVEIAE